MKPSLKQIKAWLKAGGHPENWKIGQEIGHGGFRAAFRVGDFVVKRYSRHCGQRMRLAEAKEALEHCGVKMADTWRCGAWIIQPFYASASAHPELLAVEKKANRWCGYTILDVQEGNLGVNGNNDLVAFDW